MVDASVKYYVGVRFDHGTVISFPVQNSSRYASTPSSTMKAFLEGHLQQRPAGHSTVAILDSNAKLVASKGDGKYYETVVGAIKRSFFSKGVPLRGSDSIETPPPTQPAPTAAPLQATVTASFYDSTYKHPIYSLK